MVTDFKFAPDVEIRCREYKIGVIGAGFIMADIQMAAYHKAGFTVHAAASRTFSKAKEMADRWGVAITYETIEELLADTEIDILDIAYPPHLQLDIVKKAVKHKHIKAILAQKPLAPTLEEARELVAICKETGVTLSVNQNMRYDQSMRCLKQALDQELLGRPVIATIEMRAIPHWQEFLKQYGRLTLLNMSIHHLDIMRFLFGEVEEISTMVRRDPRLEFEHEDGICVSSLMFKSGVMGVSLDDTWASPTDEGFESDVYIRWRVEGEKGIAKGTIGWPDYPDGSPSTFSICAPCTNGKWHSPKWEATWFPDAFAGVMEQLQYALSSGEEPALTGDDNLKTMTLLEAAYASVAEKRTVRPDEF